MKSIFSFLAVFALSIGFASAEGKEGKREGGKCKGHDGLSKLDTDGNGIITQAEFSADKRAQENPDKAVALFTKLDADGNGEISTEELKAAHKHKGGKGHKGGKCKKGEKTEEAPAQ